MFEEAPAKPQSLTSWELDQHLHRLVDADPKEARRALEMSQEHLPEMYQIAQDQNQEHWAQAVMNSDSMNSLMSRNREPDEMQELLQILLETDSLAAVLEQLP